MLHLLAISNACYTFSVCVSLVIGFVGGVLWVGFNRENTEKDGKDEEKKYGDVIDIDQAIFKDNTYEWKRKN